MEGTVPCTEGHAPTDQAWLQAWLRVRRIYIFDDPNRGISNFACLPPSLVPTTAVNLYDFRLFVVAVMNI